jgi:hypothetical protein
MEKIVLRIFKLSYRVEGGKICCRSLGLCSVIPLQTCQNEVDWMQTMSQDFIICICAKVGTVAAEVPLVPRNKSCGASCSLVIEYMAIQYCWLCILRIICTKKTYYFSAAIVNFHNPLLPRKCVIIELSKFNTICSKDF